MIRAADVLVIAQVVWLAALGAVCWRLIAGDLRERLLSHFDTVAINVLALAGVAILRSEAVSSIVVSVGFGAVMVAAAVVGYQLGLVGGGDVKIVFAPAILLPTFGAASWLVYLGVLIVSGAITLFQWLRAPQVERDRGLPLAPVLLAGLPLAMLVVVASAAMAAT